MAPVQINQSIELLNSPELQERIKAIKRIKNLIIGNKPNKAALLEGKVISRLTTMLNEESLDIKEQIAIVVGSLFHGNINELTSDMKCIIETSTPLLNLLSNQNIRLVEASARGEFIGLIDLLALRSILKDRSIGLDNIRIEHIESMINLIDMNRIIKLYSQSNTHSNSITKPNELFEPCLPVMNIHLRVVEIITSVIGFSVSNLNYSKYEMYYKKSLTFLVQFLSFEFDFYPKLQESTLDAISQLSRDNKELCLFIIQIEKQPMNSQSPNETIKQPNQLFVIDNMIRLSRHSRPTMRLFSCKSLVNLLKMNTIPYLNQSRIKFNVLYILIKLFEDETCFNNTAGYESATVEQIAPIIFAYFVEDSEELQKASMDANAILKLSKMMNKVNEFEKQLLQLQNESIQENVEFSIPVLKIKSLHMERLNEAIFIALAASCSLNESCRKQVIDSKCLEYIVSSLSHSNESMRCAACNCMRSLSRSVKNLRTTLVDAGIAVPLFKLLSDSSIKVKTIASATLCNIVLDFSPMKQIVLENGGIQVLVSLIHSNDIHLRINTVWALKNLLYQADSCVKKTVMQYLGWNVLDGLVSDSELLIKEQALNVLRNLACGSTDDIEFVVYGFGSIKLAEIIRSILELDSESNEPIILQTLYIIVNICTGSTEHKRLIISNDGILRGIMKFLIEPKSNLKIASIWCIINLTWTQDEGSNERVIKLKRYGVEDILLSLSKHRDLDVKDRVKTALNHFNQNATQSGMIHDHDSTRGKQFDSELTLIGIHSEASIQQMTPNEFIGVSMTTGVFPDADMEYFDEL